MILHVLIKLRQFVTVSQGVLNPYCGVQSISVMIVVHAALVSPLT